MTQTSCLIAFRLRLGLLFLGVARSYIGSYAALGTLGAAPSVRRLERYGFLFRRHSVRGSHFITCQLNRDELECFGLD